jgi:ribosomal protein L11 methyltransferase
MNYIEVLFTLDPVMPAREILLGELSELPFESFVETPEGLMAYIQEHDFNPEMIDGLLVMQIEGQRVTSVWKLIEDENWNAKWESSFDPIWVGDRMIIRAPFHEQPESIEFDIIIEPKMSFGTGHHATTFLVAEAMLDMNWKGLTVLDMGAGTGVLAILAEKMGASEVDAIDIDEWAFVNIVENNERNKTHLNMLKGGAELLPNAQKYDVVLANINRNILTTDMASYAHCMKSNALILFSGFYIQDEPEINAAADKCGLSFVRSKSKEQWNMMVFQKK